MLVVTLPASAIKNPRQFSLKAKNAGADLLEVRGDLTPDLESFTSCLPLLISPRGQGAVFMRRFKAFFVDLDFSEEELLQAVPKGTKIIRSMHNFKKTLSAVVMKKIVQKMYTKKMWMIKISTMINGYQDYRELLKIREFLNKKSIRSSVLGMGIKGHIFRIGSLIDNELTYAYLDGFEASAEGQLPLSFYRVLEGRKKPILFGILGGLQIASSLSPLVHNALFQRHNIDALYSCFPTDDFNKTIKLLESMGIRGVSVTAPFKREAFLMAKNCDGVTETIGVANTLVLTPTPPPVPNGYVWAGNPSPEGVGEWQAFNTDIDGILEGYPELRRAKTVAILGAGGAVPSAILAIRSLNPEAKITVFARDRRKAKHDLKKLETQNFSSLCIQGLREASSSSADAVLCAVSEDVSLPIPKKLSKNSLAIDLRYGKETLFMRTAKKKGYLVQNGIPMLIHQALRQFECFTGRVATKEDLAFLQKLLQHYL